MSAMIIPFPRPVGALDVATNLIEAADRFAASRPTIDRQADDMRARFARNQREYWARRDVEAGNDDGPAAA